MAPASSSLLSGRVREACFRCQRENKKACYTSDSDYTSLTSVQCDRATPKCCHCFATTVSCDYVDSPRGPIHTPPKKPHPNQRLKINVPGIGTKLKKMPKSDRQPDDNRLNPPAIGSNTQRVPEHSHQSSSVITASHEGRSTTPPSPHGSDDLFGALLAQLSEEHRKRRELERGSSHRSPSHHKSPSAMPSTVSLGLSNSPTDMRATSQGPTSNNNGAQNLRIGDFAMREEITQEEIHVPSSSKPNSDTSMTDSGSAVVPQSQSASITTCSEHGKVISMTPEVAEKTAIIEKEPEIVPQTDLANAAPIIRPKGPVSEMTNEVSPNLLMNLLSILT